MSGSDDDDHTWVINSTLTELAFLLIYGFMLVAASVTGDGVVEIVEPPPPARHCGVGELEFPNEPFCRRLSNWSDSCYRHNGGRDGLDQAWSVFRVMKADQGTATIVFTANLADTNIDEGKFEKYVGRKRGEFTCGNEISVGYDDILAMGRGFGKLALDGFENCRFQFSRIDNPTAGEALLFDRLSNSMNALPMQRAKLQAPVIRRAKDGKCSLRPSDP